MSIHYIQEKLWQAVDTLVGAGSLQHRLTYAAQYLIRLREADFRSEDLPEDMRAEFQSVVDILTTHPAEIEGEGSINASVRKLSDEEGATVGRKILAMYIKVSEITAKKVG